jgi:glutathione S-transferase
MRGHRWVDEANTTAIKAMQDKVPDSVGACYDLIESGMLKGPWVMGEDYTIADPYLFTIAQWLEQDGVDPARIPRIVDHRARMAARANVKAALAEENA